MFPQLRSVVLATLALTGLAAWQAPAGAEDVGWHRLVDGVSAYLGVFPAALVERHPRGHPEREMHGGPPRGAHRYHVTIALFDEPSGERIADAEVTARVSPLGLVGANKRLEPMDIGGAPSYGNWFLLPGADTYRIEVEIRRPGQAEPLRTEFAYRHPWR
jgi:hypothetical protein